jgi:hypothetical protein
MALTITLGELRTLSQQRADMENSQFIDTDEWNAYINASGAELYDILVQKGVDYYVVSQSFNITGSADSYALPSNVYKLTGIDYALGGQNYPMQKFIWADRFKYRYNSGVIRYRIVGNTLYFIPRAAAQTVTLWYVPPFTRLVNDGDTLDTINEWYEYIVIDAAIKARIKEESDIQELLVQKQAIAQRIEAMSADRDHAYGERVSDVTGINYPDNYWFNDQ